MPLHFNVRIIRTGDRFGLSDCLIHKDTEPMIEFFDLRYPHTPFGQFIARYYVSTFLAHRGALSLQADVPSWSLTADQVLAVQNSILRGDK